MMNEIWKPVVGYEGLYEVSNMGNVRSLFRYKKQLKPNCSRSAPYYSVELFKDKKSKRISIHRLVAMAFVPNPDNLPIVNHKDENKHNNCYENLEWVSNQENMTYGTFVKRRVTHTDYSKSVYKENAIKNGIASRKPVLQFSKDGQFIKSFISAQHANLETKINHTHICECCLGKRKSAGGFVWKYKKEE